MARAAPSSPDGDAAMRFEALYRACYEDLLRYALRRSDRPETAADVVADTFVVAWQRIDDIPADQGRAWLFGVARNVLANQHRAARRGAELANRLRTELARVTVTQPDVPAEISAAFRQLPEADQEILRLVAWEGLAADELALVLDCSANAVRIRLHRARRRFAEALRAPSLTT
ncbi:RNA polymerase, sigma subunit, ECF family [Micromonospora viridifaciens]|uniref:RNA polymerase, sigma subunit, ECF family n=1 Tax=Micromonospora viridifaciens TaxID=1881 RepID=A0A1C4Z4J1_MICVI|nr:sigma-70 family RNA polymerase sigma factor [Micromonospora viridifaciens]SCF27962.1 RNA polymerase, sigma subunit, ECF family [Micromonospora viridifaciens]